MKIKSSFITNFILLALIILVVAIFSESVIDAGKKNSIESIQSVYADSTKKITIEDIINPANLYPYLGYEASHISSTIKDTNYWIHIPLNQLTLTDDDYLIEVSKPHLSNITFYQVSESGNILKVVETGRNLAFNTREILYNSYLFSLDSQHLHGDVYMKINTESYLQVPSKLWTQIEFIEESNNNSLIFGMFYGTLMIMIIYNAFLAYGLKDIKYLFYILFVISFTCLQLVWDGYSFQYIWTNASKWDTIANPFFISQCVLWLMVFNWAFFEINTRQKTLIVIYKIIFVAIFLASAGAFILPMAIAINYSTSLAIVTLLLSIVSFVICKPKNKSHYLYITAWSVLFYMSIISALGGFNLIPYSLLSVHGIKIGIIILIVFFSLALSNKINEIEQLRIAEVEKTNLLRKLNAMSLSTNSIREFSILFKVMQQNFTSITQFETLIIGHEFNAEFFDVHYNNQMTAKFPFQECYDLFQSHSKFEVSIPSSQFLKYLNLNNATSAIIIHIESRSKQRGFIILYSRFELILNEQSKDLLIDYSYQVSMAIENIYLMEKLTLAAERDSLTKLYNRKAFFEKVQNLYTQNQPKQTFCLIMIDIDNFKHVNDQFGHMAGDIALIEISELIRNTLPKHALIGRYGGEEFIVAIHSTQKNQIIDQIETLRKVIMQTKFKINEVANVQMTISAGLIFHANNIKSLDALIELADQSLYQAKNAGRNRIVISNE